MERRVMEVNDLFYEVYKSHDRSIVMQGGARSGKTFSILQAHVAELASPESKDKGLVFSIVRKSGVSLAQSAQRDFFKIIRGLGLYSEKYHKKSKPEEYTLNGNLVEFMGIDNPDKKRGTERDYLFVNEANELSWDDFNQLAMRTKKRIVIDYNPSDEYHWIYDNVIPQSDCKYIHSTYKDNKFLPKEIIDSIERLEEIDPMAWRVFGLGERAALRGKIYTNWLAVSEFRSQVTPIYGLDFGFNNPSSLVKLGLHDGDLYVEEMIYESGLTNSDLIAKIKGLGVKGRIYCDAAEPQRIEELCRAGFNAISANKSVKDGIDFVQRHKIHVIGPNIEKEIKSYKWREDKNGVTYDEPVKFNDHAMDAMRYGAFTEWYIPPTKPSKVTHEPMLESDSRNWRAF